MKKKLTLFGAFDISIGLKLLVYLAVMFLPSPPATAQSRAMMSFYIDVSEEGKISTELSGGVFDIYANGEITEGTTERLIALVRENRINAAKVHFNSPGGSLIEGIKLGRALRTLGFNTTIGIHSSDPRLESDNTSICASACAYAFAGGVNRYVNEYTGKLGIHQFYSGSRVASISGETAQAYSGLIVAYLDEMGVDAKAFTLAAMTTSNDMVWLTPELAEELRFSNNGSTPTTAEIRVIGMQPYLRLEQEHDSSVARVLFNCKDKTIAMLFGIVTDPEGTDMIISYPKRSYLEADQSELLVVPGAAGISGVDSVVWIQRQISPQQLASIASSKTIFGWVDGHGALRYGTKLHMQSVKEKVLSFADQCYSS